MPLARMMQLSLVEVSPSTLIRLKLWSPTEVRAFCSRAGEIAQSVVRKQSMVPMLGWIMPLPLAMPPMTTSLPSSWKETATSFFWVSVVMMAWAASSLASGEWASFPASTGIPSWMGAMGKVWPMTPVEATSTCSGERDRA